MITTINISLPSSMYEDMKAYLARRGYTSVSELVRDAVRDVLYPQLTENGFTPEFEEEVLQAAAESRQKDKAWRTEKDIDEYFDALRKRITKQRKISHNGQN